MPKPHSLCAAALAALALQPMSAQAQEFGIPGELAISSDANLNFTNSSSPSSGWSLALAPSVSFFVGSELSLGIGLRYSHFHSSDVFAPDGYLDDESLGASSSVGFNLPLFSNALSLWPQLSFNFDDAWSKGQPNQAVFGLGAFAPVLIHPAPHFFVGLGPFFDTDLTASDSSAKETTWGLQFIVGGWFGGPVVPASERGCPDSHLN